MILYPNPTKNLLKISSAEILKKVIVCDNAGRIKNIEYPNANEVELVLKEYNEGIYFVKIHVARRELIRKIVVAK